jgi:hypothetical protein
VVRFSSGTMFAPVPFVSVSSTHVFVTTAFPWGFPVQDRSVATALSARERSRRGSLLDDWRRWMPSSFETRRCGYSHEFDPVGDPQAPGTVVWAYSKGMADADRAVLRELGCELQARVAIGRRRAPVDHVQREVLRLRLGRIGVELVVVLRHVQRDSVAPRSQQAGDVELDLRVGALDEPPVGYLGAVEPDVCGPVDAARLSL